MWWLSREAMVACMSWLQISPSSSHVATTPLACRFMAHHGGIASTLRPCFFAQCPRQATIRQELSQGPELCLSKDTAKSKCLFSNWFRHSSLHQTTIFEDWSQQLLHEAQDGSCQAHGTQTCPR